MLTKISCFIVFKINNFLNFANVNTFILVLFVLFIFKLIFACSLFISRINTQISVWLEKLMLICAYLLKIRGFHQILWYTDIINLKPYAITPAFNIVLTFSFYKGTHERFLIRRKNSKSTNMYLNCLVAYILIPVDCMRGFVAQLMLFYITVVEILNQNA